MKHGDLLTQHKTPEWLILRELENYGVCPMPGWTMRDAIKLKFDVITAAKKRVDEQKKAHRRPYYNPGGRR